PNGRPPFSAVSAARQREALAFIADAGLGENLYRFRPELLNKLAPERWWHWGVNPFREGRIDFPLHDWALAFQGTLVQLLMDPQVLSRVRDAELRAESRNQTVTIPDILTTLTASVWAEAGVQGSQRARNTTSVRRHPGRAAGSRFPPRDGRRSAAYPPLKTRHPTCSARTWPCRRNPRHVAAGARVGRAGTATSPPPRPRRRCCRGPPDRPCRCD